MKKIFAKARKLERQIAKNMQPALDRLPMPYRAVEPGFEHIDPTAVDGRLVDEGYMPVRYMSREEVAKLCPPSPKRPPAPEPNSEGA